MARKDILKGLMEPPSTSGDMADSPPARVDTAKPRYTGGAIGAVSQSIAELKRRAIAEIDPRLIDNAGLHDRLDQDDDLDALAESIREYGQQVPVLLRPNPNDVERYQVVYGRRRVAALKRLGQPVKALVRVLDDRELVMAQGQENTARKDLTFIEKANFARQMVKAGYSRKAICDALHMDKTLISRMLSVADRVPVEVIEAIGSAPGIGRDRWLTLADMIEGRAEEALALAKGKTSDQRFDAVMTGLSKGKEKQARKSARRKEDIGFENQPIVVVDENGRKIADARREAGRVVVVLNSRTCRGFDEWLVNHLAEIHRHWIETGE